MRCPVSTARPGAWELVVVKGLGDRGHAQPRLAIRLAAQLTNALHHGRLCRPRAKRLPPLAAPSPPSNPIPRRTQLQHHYRLLELREGAQHLPDERPGRVTVGRGQVCPICRQHKPRDTLWRVGGRDDDRLGCRGVDVVWSTTGLTTGIVWTRRASLGINHNWPFNGWCLSASWLTSPAWRTCDAVSSSLVSSAAAALHPEAPRGPARAAVAWAVAAALAGAVYPTAGPAVASFGSASS